MSRPGQPAQPAQPYVRGQFAGAAPTAAATPQPASPGAQRMAGGMGGARIGATPTAQPAPAAGLTPQQQQLLAQQEAQRRALLAQQQAAAARAGSPAPAATAGARVASPAPAPAPAAATLQRTATGSPAGAGDSREFAARGDGMRTPRRPSTVVVQSERKTEFWNMLIAQMEQLGGFKMDENARNDVISRVLAYGLVQDKRARDAAGIVDPPPAGPVLQGLEKHMLERLTELNNGQPVRLDPKTPVLERICRMEKAIQVLEARKAKEEEEEAAKIKAKMEELSASLATTTKVKEEQREQNRRTMKLELDNLRDSMAKMAQETQGKGAAPPPAAAQAMDAMAQKMARLEAALRLMNEERKTAVDDKETLLLKRKLAMMEDKFKELEASKQIKAAESNADALKDKLLMMEEKLAKMERRKSMSIATMMQEKMNQMEKQLEMMRGQRGGAPGAAGGGNPEMEKKMAAMEAELKRMRETKVTPAMVNDEETNALRATVKKLEQAMLGAEKNMEAQRKKIEEERNRAAEERRKEELEFREASRKREQELLKRLQMMEQKMATGGGGGDPQLAARMQRLEQNLSSGQFGGGGADPNTAAKLKEMEEKLQATQRALQEEREMMSAFTSMKPTEGPALEKWQSDMQIAWLMEQNKKLMEKLDASTKLIDSKMEQMSKMTFAGGGAVHKSGLGYKEINEKLAELQKELFDDATDDRRKEQLNIEYEKLISELEMTPEYQKEQAELKDKWKKENEPLNQQALQEVRQAMRAMGDQAVLELLKSKPELRMVLNTPDQIMKKHENDFNSLTTQNLTLQEARALFAAMPTFRKEQAKQTLWVESLKTKIENELTKPKKPPPPPKAAPVPGGGPPPPPKVFKKPAAAKAGGGDFLQELLQKRKPKD